jgi:uncharacterized MAPEG superfamily protein
MTLSLACLPVACLLPFVWSLATIPARNQLPGGLDNRAPRLQQAQLTGLGARALGAHQNAWEALPVFVAAVLTAHVTGADPSITGPLSVAWVVARLAHGAAYLADVHAARSLSFMGGLACAMALFGLAAVQG